LGSVYLSGKEVFLDSILVSSAAQVGASIREITPGDGNSQEVEATHPIQATYLPSPSQATLRCRKNKWVKTRGEADIVLGKDISILEAMDMAKMVMVGMERDRCFNAKFLKDWGDNSWGVFLGQAPIVKTLTKGWLSFKFRNYEEEERVLKQPWPIDSMPIFLKR